MSKRFIDGLEFSRMSESGARMLKANADKVNGLNVFPVPDGDTGTNMSMTITSGIEQLRKHPSAHIGKSAETFSKGLLMGARGNSGVILSQLLRGFAKSVQPYDKINAQQFAAALQKGVDTAYQAVVRPVEGTILTVSREAAKHAVAMAKRTDDLGELMREVLEKAKEVLARTPDMLPVLKQVGVVDSGGQGLVFIYEGFSRFLNGEEQVPETEEEASETVSVTVPRTGKADAAEAAGAAPARAQLNMSTEEIEFPYDMEFFILPRPDSPPFVEADFRRALAENGDSILIIADDDAIKVHVHTKRPGDVLNLALPYGELTRFHLENMKETHRHIIEDYGEKGADANPGEETGDGTEENAQEQQGYRKPYGIVAVAAGQGITDILESLGVDCVLSGGQTMNPSTEDLLQAINSVKAERVFVLPNNSNIIMAAEQAKSLSDKEVMVVPTRTIPQGIAAALAFQEHLGAEENLEAMTRAAKQVRSGQITESIRDTNMDELEIRKGDYIGILENKIVCADPNLILTGQRLLDHLIESGDEVVTILTGQLADEAATKAMLDYVQEQYPGVEIEVHHGGQPVYHYLFSAE